jgi:hypothetical protein
MSFPPSAADLHLAELTHQQEQLILEKQMFQFYMKQLQSQQLATVPSISSVLDPAANFPKKRKILNAMSDTQQQYNENLFNQYAVIIPAGLQASSFMPWPNAMLEVAGAPIFINPLQEASNILSSGYNFMNNSSLQSQIVPTTTQNSIAPCYFNGPIAFSECGIPRYEAVNYQNK